jgi:hypothetical protein
MGGECTTHRTNEKSNAGRNVMVEDHLEHGDGATLFVPAQCFNG